MPKKQDPTKFSTKDYEELESIENEFWEAQEKVKLVEKKMETFQNKKSNEIQAYFDKENKVDPHTGKKEDNTPPPRGNNENGWDTDNFKNKIVQIGGGGNNSNHWIKIGLLVVATTFAFNFFNKEEVVSIPISEFLQEKQLGTFTEINLSGESATGIKESGEKVKTVIGQRDSFTNLGFLEPQEGVKIEIKGSEGQKFWTDLILSFLPLILLLGLMVYSMRGMKGLGKFPFGGSKRGMEPIKPKTTFDDVAGQDEAKFELQEMVEFLKRPSQFLKMGAKIPKGVILSGPPGTGKTLLARAVAGEAHVPFFSISGSEFVEMFVGVGASRVRQLFENARKQSPAIIFIDEIDAIGRKRNAGMGGGNDEREQTLNQILTEMDGFENETGVIVIAATNRVDILDKALMRPGRFDRKITVNNPNIKDREAILAVHIKDKPLSKEVNLEKIAARTVGFSGADLENMMNEAAIFAARAKKKEIDNTDVDMAIDRVTMGTEKKSLVMSPAEKKMTAYHEVGHALAAYLLPTADPVHKITIVPRGMALGATHIAPETESYHTTKKKYFEEICVLMGGLAAEKLYFGDTTSGVSNDLERASGIANAMVKKFGMSDEIGPVVVKDPGEEGFSRAHSEAFEAQIDTEVQKLLKDGFNATKKLLTDNEGIVHAISKALLEKETLNREEFESFFAEEEKGK